MANARVRNLIVNADDLAWAEGVNRGIAEAHRNGIVTSTTILANGAAFASAVDLVKVTPSLGVGVHLNLSDGKPVSPPETVPSILNDRGEFKGGPDALLLRVARRNLRAYRLGKRVRLVRTDLFAGLEPARYDLIVANPPYVGAAAMRRLPPEYRREPRLALDGGRDGLEFARRILPAARNFLRPRGLLVVEIGRNRGKLERAFPRLPFIWPETSAGYDCVFVLSREDLSESALQ